MDNYKLLDMLLVSDSLTPTFTMSRQKVNVAEYLFTRLHQLGVKDLHGVPGDFNLVALDYVEPCGINWVGNCNELNAGWLIRTPLCVNYLTEALQDMPPMRTVVCWAWVLC